MEKPRVMIFDILRILAVALVLVSHIASVYVYLPLINQTWNTWVGRIFFFDIGSIGVLIFIFISGAVLEINKKPITTIYSYFKFQLHRLLRLYPAYWMSLLFAIMIALYVNNINGIGDLFWQFSGFNAFIGNWGGSLNVIGWSIGLFVVLYLLYPFISRAINSKPYTTLACLLFVSLCSTFFINTWAMTTNPPKALLIARWVPLCSLIYFGLGIFIAKKSWYPKTIDTTGIISYFGELTFYIFLFHVIIIDIAKISIPVYLAYTIVLAMVAMMVDNRIHEYLKIAGKKL